MRQESFKMERPGLVKPGDKIQITEYQSYMNYSYIIEPAVAMSGCYPNSQRIKAKEGKAGDVAKELEAYRKKQIEEAVQYPMNMTKLEASQVITHGDYVFFVMLGGADMEAEEQGADAALKSAKENNQIAVDVIAGFFK